MARDWRWVPGQWNAICDVCGFKFKSGELKERWDGQKVCIPDWEQRHVLDFFKPLIDHPEAAWTRDDNIDTSITTYTLNHELTASDSTFDYFFDGTGIGDLLCVLPAANEGIRTNKILQNTNIQNAAWTLNNATTIGTGSVNLVPDGGASVITLVPTAANTIHTVTQTSQALSSSGIIATASAYVKASGYDQVYLTICDPTVTNSISFGINITAGTPAFALTATGTGVALTGIIRSVGSGWMQIIVTGSIPTLANYTVLIGVATAGNKTFVGNTFSGVNIWGVQLEEGSTATSQLTTTTTAITRAISNTFTPIAAHSYSIYNADAIHNVLVSSSSQISGSIIVAPGTCARFTQVYSDNVWIRSL